MTDEKKAQKDVPSAPKKGAEVIPLPTALAVVVKETRRLAEKSGSVHFPDDVVKLCLARDLQWDQVLSVLRRGEIILAPQLNTYGVLEWSVEHWVRGCDRYVVVTVSKRIREDGTECLDVKKVDWRRAR